MFDEITDEGRPMLQVDNQEYVVQKSPLVSQQGGFELKIDLDQGDGA